MKVFNPQDSNTSIDTNLLGGKASSLLKLKHPLATVPAWIALYDIELPLDQLLLDEVIEQRQWSNVPLAVRSSCNIEDGHQQSFAGLFETILNVKGKTNIANAITQVVSSINQERVTNYCHENFIDPATLKMTVILQEMIEPEWAGVLFSTNPIDQQILISRVEGLGEQLVSGESDSQDMSFNRNAKFPDNVWGKLATIGIDIEKDYGYPIDLEWAITNNQVSLLQARPITQKQEKRIIWDNSNIVESYGGVTLPLTYSFISSGYQRFYFNLVSQLHIPTRFYPKISILTESMLGHLKGRIYYNLSSWYELLNYIPGLSSGQKDLDSMLGAESDSNTLEYQNTNYTLIEKLRFYFFFLLNYLNHPKAVDQFLKRFDDLANDYEKEIEHLGATATYVKLLQFYQTLLSFWMAPLINDIYVMIYFGLAKKLSKSFFHDENIVHHLVSGEGLASMAPAEWLHQFTKSNLDEINHSSLQDLLNRPAFIEKLSPYIKLYGYRCENELKIESIDYTMDINPLVRSIKSMASSDLKQRPPKQESPEMILAKLNFFQRLVFKFVLTRLKKVIAYREITRLRRTTLFGITRKYTNQLGKCLYHSKVIQNSRDIYYLKFSEIKDLLEGAISSSEIQLIINHRTKIYNEYQQEDTLPDRFVTWGPVLKYPCKSMGGNELLGKPSSPGIVEGEIIVLQSINQQNVDWTNKIVVTYKTDPGWIILFPSIKGLIVEKGSTLSHSAVVAREMGLPSIVGLPGATTILKNGMYVQINATTGVVNIIERN